MRVEDRGAADQDGLPMVGSSDLAAGLDARHVGQIEVHQDQVERPPGAISVDRGLPVRDGLDLVILEDQELMDETGELRDINRHFYSMDEADEAMAQPVVKRLLTLMRFRSQYPAFDGRFELNYSNSSSVAMAWRHGEYYCELFVDLNFNTSVLSYLDTETLEKTSISC